MNDEIKEILEDLRNKNMSVDDLTHNDKTKLLDYITNLQNENERLRTVLNGSEEKRKKAIEWVKEHIETYQKNEIVILDWDNFSDPRNLLKILKGSDKDENN